MRSQGIQPEAKENAQGAGNKPGGGKYNDNNHNYVVPYSEVHEFLIQEESICRELEVNRPALYRSISRAQDTILLMRFFSKRGSPPKKTTPLGSPCTPWQ